jgi:DNA-directed RNA polymerase specialized sigma24 family protein
MHWFQVGSLELRKKGTTKTVAEQAAFAEQRESLHRTALMITGSPTLAEQSIIDAAGLTDTDRYAFRKWLVQWGHLATARVAIHAVRSLIQETAEQYASWNCSHRKHEPVSPENIEEFRKLEAQTIIQELDVLARSVFVLHGCQGVPLSECVHLLNVPLSAVTGAYCKALQWLRASTRACNEVGDAEFTELRLVDHGPDGVPVWGNKCLAR